MTNKQINFKQERDFGDLFNATFSFITQEFKRLATAILYFVVPFMLLSAIALTLYSVKAQEMSQSFTQGDKPDPFAAFSIMGALMGYIGIAIILSLIASAMMLSTVYSYITLYIQNGSEGFSINDVWNQVTKNFLRILGTIVVVGILVTIGAMLCLIPGIYLGVTLSIVLCILVFEERSFSDAFNRSFKLMKNNWWETFGVLFIVFVIMYIFMFLASIPGMLFGVKSLLTNMKDIQNHGLNLSIGYYIMNSITHLITQLFTVIPIVVTAFIYYSLVEKVEKPSLMDKIDQIGANE